MMRLSAAGVSPDSDQVAIEEPLEIRVAGETIAITMRTPGEDEALAVGFLLSEGIIRGADDLSSVSHCGKPTDEGYGNTIDATPAPGVALQVEKVEASRRGTLTTAACGVCGRRSVSDLLSLCGTLSDDTTRIEFELLATSTDKLKQAQQNFSRTGGTHAAMAFSHEGEVLAAFEDVGRHNAVDKVIGRLVMDGVLGRSLSSDSGHRAMSRKPPRPKPVLLAVSGRASFEIVQKATVARIPIVASVSAASSLAIDLAQRANLTLAAFVRPGKLNIYSGANRVITRTTRVEQ
jgi:FdhD protein